MIKEHEDKYINWYNSLNEKDKKNVDEYFDDLELKINLPKKEKNNIIKDFENAFIYYINNNYSIDKIRETLKLTKLGEFYNQEQTYWYPLDSAAKVYPISMRRNWMAVFRISMYLKKDVVPEILQMALTFTIKRFPYFATTLNKGFFWHYLDSSCRRYYISEEHNCPCGPMKISSIGTPSFRVYYYHNRISVEFFHVLTDGTGGTIFLKTLVNEYLRLLGYKTDISSGVFDIEEKSKTEEAKNEFLRNIKSNKTQGFINKKALQLDGKVSRVKPCQVLHFDMSSKEVIELAHKKNVSATSLICGFLFLVLKYSTSKNGLINIQIPINMRKFYKSNTMRNFSLYTVISLMRDDINDFDDVIKEVDRQLKEKTTQEYMEQFMKSTRVLVSSLRFVPLFIKKPIAKIVYGFLGDKVFTTTLSNVGKVEMPSGVSNEIDKMDLVLGTTLTNRAMFSLISYNDIMTLSIAKNTTNSALELNLYSLLLKEGINPTVYGSENYENK